MSFAQIGLIRLTLPHLFGRTGVNTWSTKLRNISSFLASSKVASNDVFTLWVREAMDQFSSYWCKHTAGQWPNDAFCLYNFFYNEFPSNSHTAHMGRLFSVFWTLRIQQKYVAAFALNLLWINQCVSHFQYERKASPCRGNHQKLHLQQYLFWCWIVVFLWNGK